MFLFPQEFLKQLCKKIVLHHILKTKQAPSHSYSTFNTSVPLANHQLTLLFFHVQLCFWAVRHQCMKRAGLMKFSLLDEYHQSTRYHEQKGDTVSNMCLLTLGEKAAHAATPCCIT